MHRVKGAFRIRLGSDSNRIADHSYTRFAAAMKSRLQAPRLRKSWNSRRARSGIVEALISNVAWKEFARSGEKSPNDSRGARESGRPPDSRCRRAAGGLARTPLGSARFQTREVDHETIAHVVLEHALVSNVDLLIGNHLDIGGDIVLGAEVEHLLGLADAADQRAGQASPRRREILALHRGYVHWVMP